MINNASTQVFSRGTLKFTTDRKESVCRCWKSSDLLDSRQHSTNVCNLAKKKRTRARKESNFECVLPVHLREQKLIGVLAGLDALTSKSSNLLAYLGRILGLTYGYQQLPQLGHLAIQIANHLPPTEREVQF